MRQIHKIIIHCSATKPSMNVDAKTIRKWHVLERGWSDIGYHFVICRDGTVETGRDLKMSGAHVSGQNAFSIGVCLVGGMAEDGSDDCNFTASQWKALPDLIETLKQNFPDATIHGHREFDSSKSCPTFDVQSFFD